MGKKAHAAKAQAAFEYILMITIVLLIMAPGLYYLMSKAEETRYDVARAQLDMIGHHIMEDAAVIYYSGENSKRTYRTSLPVEVKRFWLGGKDNMEIIFTMDTPQGDRDVVFVSDVDIEFPYPVEAEAIPNINRIFLVNKDDRVILCTNINMLPPCDV